MHVLLYSMPQKKLFDKLGSPWSKAENEWSYKAYKKDRKMLYDRVDVVAFYSVNRLNADKHFVFTANLQEVGKHVAEQKELQILSKEKLVWKFPVKKINFHHRVSGRKARRLSRKV
ncbi:hypothetical protein V6N11_004089 [Hibiscus sabdariffa]|uniref:Uncharacterized protein n=1 Tax=Hibiscus sabdariffa TaxID=183260 RepID=A0ABR2SFU2_9ROSI